MNRGRPNRKRITNLGPIMNLWKREERKDEEEEGTKNVKIESNVLNECCKPIDQEHLTWPNHICQSGDFVIDEYYSIKRKSHLKLI